MPKTKTRSAAKKRFRVTGGGKLQYQRAGVRHNFENKRSKEKRHLAKEVDVPPEFARLVKRMLGMR